MFMANLARDSFVGLNAAVSAVGHQRLRCAVVDVPASEPSDSIVRHQRVIYFPPFWLYFSDAIGRCTACSSDGIETSLLRPRLADSAKCEG